MKHIKTFESFSVNEELFGLPSLKEMKAKAQAWLQSNMNNPKLQTAMDKLKMEYQKLDPRTQSKLQDLAHKNPEELQVAAEKANESKMNESFDWKSALSKFFKFLGIATVSVGFLEAAWSIVTMTMSGSGYTQLPGVGMEAGKFVGVGMVTMLIAILPLILSTVLEPEGE